MSEVQESHVSLLAEAWTLAGNGRDAQQTSVGYNFRRHGSFVTSLHDRSDLAAQAFACTRLLQDVYGPDWDVQRHRDEAGTVRFEAHPIDLSEQAERLASGRAFVSTVDYVHVTTTALRAALSP